MNCESVANILDLYVDGRLSFGRTSQVSVHLKNCAKCQALSQPALKPKKIAVPLDLKARLKAALSEAEPVFDLGHPVVYGGIAPVLAGALVYLCLTLIAHWAGPGVISQQLGVLP